MSEGEEGPKPVGRPPTPPAKRHSCGVTVRLTPAQARQLAALIPPGTKVGAYVREQLGLEAAREQGPPPKGE